MECCSTRWNAQCSVKTTPKEFEHCNTLGPGFTSELGSWSTCSSPKKVCQHSSCWNKLTRARFPRCFTSPLSTSGGILSSTRLLSKLRSPRLPVPCHFQFFSVCWPGKCSYLTLGFWTVRREISFFAMFGADWLRLGWFWSVFWWCAAYFNLQYVGFHEPEYQLWVKIKFGSHWWKRDGLQWVPLSKHWSDVSEWSSFSTLFMVILWWTRYGRYLDIFVFWGFSQFKFIL